MKQFRTFTIFALMLLLAISATSQDKSAKATQYKKLKYPALRQPVIPEPARYELANGMVVYLLEDHTLPTIEASLMVHAGSRYEPADKIGLASLTGQVMRTGGTTTKTGDELDDILEKVAASVETYIGTSSGGARLSVLKEDIDLGLSTLADILKNPAFRDDKIDLAKIQAKSGISRRNDQVAAIAGREFNRLIYGPNHPYARITEYATIENIAKQDMIDYHKKYFIPNGMLIAVWGDFKADEMKSKIEKTFGGWERGSVTLPPVQQPRMASAKTVNFIKKDDVNQSQIYIGHLGGMLNDSESPQLNLADQAFGGGFASNLFKKVRSEQGLAYSVGSSWGESFDYQGVFRMSGSTKSGSTVKMIKSIISEFEKTINNGITDAELKYAKDTYLNSYVFEFESKANVINKLMTLEYYGYPKDYYQKQIKDIQDANKQSVSEAIKKRWNSGTLTILVVGKDSEFDEPLSTLGTVKTIDITIPAPPEKIPEPTTETINKAKEILRKTLGAVGGPKVAAIKDRTQNSKMTITTPMGEMEAEGDNSYVLPNKMVSKMSMARGEMQMAFDGKSGWMSMGGNTQDLPSSQSEEMQKQMFLNSIYVLQNFDKPEFLVYYFKDDNINNKAANVVIIKHVPSNGTARWFVDAQSSMLMKTISKGRGQAGPVDAEVFYEDYRDVGGIKLPHKVQQFADGKRTMEILTNSYKINTGIKDEMFKKPQ
jgi:zinc protease